MTFLFANVRNISAQAMLRAALVGSVYTPVYTMPSSEGALRMAPWY